MKLLRRLDSVFRLGLVGERLGHIIKKFVRKKTAPAGRLALTAALVAALVVSAVPAVAQETELPSGESDYGTLEGYILHPTSNATIDNYYAAYLVKSTLDNMYGSRWHQFSNNPSYNMCMNPQYWVHPQDRNTWELEKEAVCRFYAYYMSVPANVGPVLISGKYYMPRVKLNRYHLAEWVRNLVSFHNKHNAPPTSTDTYRMGDDSSTLQRDTFDLPTTVTNYPSSITPETAFRDLCENMPYTAAYQGVKLGIQPGIRMLEPLSDFGELLQNSIGEYYWDDFNPASLSDDNPRVPDPRGNVDGNTCEERHLDYGGTLPARLTDTSIMLGRYQCATRQYAIGDIEFGDKWTQPPGDYSDVTSQCWDLFWKGVDDDTGDPIVYGSMVDMPHCTDPYDYLLMGSLTWMPGGGSYWEGYGFNEVGQSLGWDGSRQGGRNPWEFPGMGWGDRQPCHRPHYKLEGSA